MVAQNLGQCNTHSLQNIQSFEYNYSPLNESSFLKPGPLSAAVAKLRLPRLLPCPTAPNEKPANGLGLASDCDDVVDAGAGSDFLMVGVVVKLNPPRLALGAAAGVPLVVGVVKETEVRP